LKTHEMPATGKLCSVHMMVRDAASIAGRALGFLQKIPEAGRYCEVCFVDTGSTDGTPDAIARACAALGVSCSGTAVSPTSRPDLYFPDEPASYAPYSAPDPTGRMLLRDWATARNLGLDMCRGEWVMKLDADDMVLRPDNILAGIRSLSATRRDVEIVACPYEVCGAGGEVLYVTMYTRFWRNKPEIRFRQRCHENVDWYRDPGGSNWLMTNKGLSFRDLRDCPGRVPHRNYKVLLREYCDLTRAGSEPGRHLLLYLADESLEVDPGFAAEITDRIMARTSENPLHRSDMAWIRIIRGLSHEKRGLIDEAMDEYSRAAAQGSWRAQLLLALLGRRIMRSHADEYAQIVTLKSISRSDQLQLAQLSRILRRDDWRTELAAAVAANEGRCWPQHASIAEVELAKRILAETSASGDGT